MWGEMSVWNLGGDADHYSEHCPLPARPSPQPLCTRGEATTGSAAFGLYLPQGQAAALTAGSVTPNSDAPTPPAATPLQRRLGTPVSLRLGQHQPRLER